MLALTYLVYTFWLWLQGAGVYLVNKRLYLGFKARVCRNKLVKRRNADCAVAGYKVLQHRVGYRRLYIGRILSYARSVYLFKAIILFGRKVCLQNLLLV